MPSPDGPLRRSERLTKGIPPPRYGDTVSSTPCSEPPCFGFDSDDSDSTIVDFVLPPPQWCDADDEVEHAAGRIDALGVRHASCNRTAPAGGRVDAAATRGAMCSSRSKPSDRDNARRSFANENMYDTRHTQPPPPHQFNGEEGAAGGFDGAAYMHDAEFVSRPRQFDYAAERQAIADNIRFVRGESRSRPRNDADTVGYYTEQRVSQRAFSSQHTDNAAEMRSAMEASRPQPVNRASGSGYVAVTDMRRDPCTTQRAHMREVAVAVSPVGKYANAADSRDNRLALRSQHVIDNNAVGVHAQRASQSQYSNRAGVDYDFVDVTAMHRHQSVPPRTHRPDDEFAGGLSADAVDTRDQPRVFRTQHINDAVGGRADMHHNLRTSRPQHDKHIGSARDADVAGAYKMQSAPRTYYSADNHVIGAWAASISQYSDDESSDGYVDATDVHCFDRQAYLANGNRGAVHRRQSYAAESLAEFEGNAEDDRTTYYDCTNASSNPPVRPKRGEVGEDAQASIRGEGRSHSRGTGRTHTDAAVESGVEQMCRMMAKLEQRLEEDRRTRDDDRMIRVADRRERDDYRLNLERMVEGLAAPTLGQSVQCPTGERASMRRTGSTSALPATSNATTRAAEHARPATRYDQLQQPIQFDDDACDTGYQRKLVDLPAFDGAPEWYPRFRAAFHNTTAYYKYNDTENQARLNKSLSGAALEAVASFMLHPEHVADAMDILEDNFGDPEQLAESQVARARALPALSDAQMAMLRPMSNVVRNVVRYLDTPTTQNHLNDAKLLRELVCKLPPARHFDWALYADRIYPNVTLTAFSEWLTRIARVVKYVANPADLAKSLSKPNTAPSYRINKTTQPKRLMLNDAQDATCGLCSRTHSIIDCDQFSNMAWEDRWHVVKEKNLCFGCLSDSHILPSCPTRKECGVDGCKKWHSPMLHQIRAQQPKEHLVGTTREGPSGSTLLFRVVPVTLNANGRSLRTFALLDEGSSVTLIDDRLADELKLSGTTSDLSMRWFGEQATVVKSRKVTVEISGEGTGCESTTMSARTVRNLTLPKQSVDLKELHQTNPHLREVPLVAYTNAVPRILIGLDNHRLSRPRDLRCGNEEESLSAVLTKLGWVVYGSEGPEYLPNAMVFLVDGERNEEYDMLNEVVRNFIMSEDFGVTLPLKTIESDDDIRSRTIMASTTRRVGDRFETGLLWRSDDVRLPPSYNMALRRLASVEAKMRREPELAELYADQIKAYVTKGYARKLSIEEAKTHDERTWYLPHFSVRNPNKPGKFRLVFDAAAMVGDVCLNSALLSGPDENIPLSRLLFRFRIGPVGVCGDIREMFHQIRIRSEDQNAQRFLWREGDSSKPPDIYAMEVMTFGATCSPALAQHVKNSNAKIHEKEFPEAADAIRRLHYVDDYVASFATPEEAAKVTAEVVEVHRRGGFELRGFVSNELSVLAALGHETGPGQIMAMESDATVEKILGMSWSTDDDTFCFQTRFSRVSPEILSGTQRPTKRSILSTSMSVFDPFGLLANFTLPPKLMVQDLYRLGLDWDEPVPDDINDRWQSWRAQIERTRLLRVSRCYCPTISTATDLQLHIFADASELAYAAVAYWRMTCAGETVVSFVFGKAKVAPNTLLSIPRLELNAAVLATRLLVEIRCSHDLQISKTFMWSDSETVLAWIRSDQRRYKPYVGHRVAEIVDSAPSSCWRWVPTSMNVADDATRVKHPPTFDPNSRWVRGPGWLQDNEDSWPKGKEKENRAECLEETRSKYVGLIGNDQTINFNRFSKYLRLIRTVAWATRFASNAMAIRRGKKRAEGELDADEIGAAVERLCRMVQREEFEKEYNAMQSEKPVEKGSSIFQLKPYLDEAGIIRIHGRTDAADEAYMSSDAKRPILLPRGHRFTRLLVHHHHEQLAHQLTEATIGAIRTQFWVPQIRVLVRSVQQSCQVCRMRTAMPRAPVMGQLPPDRLTPYVRPFTNTGMDYFGPVMVKIGRRREKRWVALFTCMSVRAVHLEVAADLSTDACLVCIRNFCNLRGVPALIRCDNGTNFVGARNLLEKDVGFFDDNAIQRELASRGIRWKLNCPGNPEAGGAWERLVQSVKKVLAVTLQEVEPEVETLRAHLIEASNIINARPLTHVPVDPQEEEPITPNHFLLGGPNISPLPDPGDVRALCTREQWVLCRELSRRFWLKWVRDYLPELTRRSKHYPEREQLKMGDLVIVCDYNLPRSRWRRGRVLEVKTGEDGEVRTAKLRTTDGEYWRPVAKLAILDVSPPQMQSADGARDVADA